MAHIEINAGNDPFYGLVNRRILENNIGGLASELEGEFLAAAGGQGGELFADLR